MTSLDPDVAKFAVLLGIGFARDMQRMPTRAEIDIVVRHLGRMPNPATEQDTEKAWSAALAEIRAATPAG